MRMAKAIPETKAMGRGKAVKVRQSDIGEDERLPAPDSEEDEEEVPENWENERFRTTVLINLASIMEVRFSILPARTFISASPTTCSSTKMDEEPET